MTPNGTHAARRGHFAFIGTSEASHLGALVQLCYTLLHLHPDLDATLIYEWVANPRVDEVVNAQPEEWRDAVSQRVRRVYIGKDEEGDMRLMERKLGKAMETIRPALSPLITELFYSGEGGVVTLDVVVADMFLADVAYETVHAQSAKRGVPPAKVFHQNGSNAVGHSRVFGAGWTEVLNQYERMKANGRSDDDITLEEFWASDGALETGYDVPSMYSYEHGPQIGAMSFPVAAIGRMLVQQQKMYRQVDGWICYGCPELEPESIEHIANHTGRPVYAVGPAVNAQALSGKLSSVASRHVCLDFLDAALQEHGQHSALYFSLGSWIWPDGRPELIHVVLETLLELEKPIPFIFSAKPPNANKLPQELRDRIARSDRGIIVDWAPQPDILRHPATAAILTHGGAASFYESICASVPTIGLPFGADQPCVVAYGIQQGTAKQLFQFSTHQNGKVFANGVKIDSNTQSMKQELVEVLQAVTGDEGARMRENAQKLRIKWEESLHHGQAKENLLRIGRIRTGKEVS